jgi:hypothetical protein
MKVEEIAEAIAKLPPDQLARFRRWFTAFEAGRGDHGAAKSHVCFTPESGHVQCTSSCLLWARSGHCRQNGAACSMRSR